MNARRRSAIESMGKYFSLEKVQEDTVNINDLERTSSYSGYRQSAQYCENALKQAGFKQVKTFSHPADGKTSALDTIMPEAWDLTRRSFLKIVSGDMPEYERMLADTNHHPIEATIWSKPTPKGGVTAELVNFADLDPENPDVRGKWVLMVPFKAAFYQKLAAAGAVGIAASDFRNFETSPDDPVWFNGQGRCGWYHAKGDLRLPVFSIPPIRASRLMKRMKNEKVIVHGEMNSRIYDGEIFTVTGIIPGESDEEYALMAHIYEPFLADDALGFATACELGRVLRERKTPLKKTLRVIISMELYGFSAYLEKPEHRRKILAAQSLDGFVYRTREIDLRLSPISLPSFTDWFFRDWFTKYGNCGWEEKKGTLSDDTFPGDPAIGFPVIWLHSPSGHHHHCTDVYYQPEWPWCRDKFNILAAALEELLTLDFKPDYEVRAVREFRRAAEAVLKNADLSNYEKNIRFEAEYERYAAMLRSWERFSGRKVDLRPLTALRDQLKKKLPEYWKDQFRTVEYRAMNVVPERLVVGAPFCMSRVPYAERRRVSISRPLWALFDGKRNLLECIRTWDMESGYRTSDASIQAILRDLPYLEKYGYVKLKPAVELSQSQVEKTLRQLGIRSGMKLIVHSAFSALGKVDGGPEGFCRTLMKLIGPKGTLMMPSFTFNIYEREDYGKPFDYLNSPSTCGILTETFRKLPGVLRSADPCHAICVWGNHAAEFVRDHHKVPTVSRFSPMGLLAAEDGWCLTIAAADAVSYMHVVESEFKVPCLGVRTEEYVSILSNGEKVKIRTWGWRKKTCPDCPACRTEEIFEDMRRRGVLHEIKLGNAAVFLFRLADYRVPYARILKQCRCAERKSRPRKVSVTVKSDWDPVHERLKPSDAFTGDLPEFRK